MTPSVDLTVPNVEADGVDASTLAIAVLLAMAVMLLAYIVVRDLQGKSPPAKGRSVPA